MNLLILAIKDLKILWRDKMGAFFILGFPVLMGLFFGMVMGGMSEGGRGKMEIAVVDQDNSPQSQKFIAALSKNDSLRVVSDQLEPAMDSVRKGKRTGMLVVPPEFGKTAGMFWQVQPEIQLGVDPSRAAESGMMQGLVMQAMGELIGDRFRDPKSFLPSIERARSEMQASGLIGDATSVFTDKFFDSLQNMIESADQLQAQDGEGDAGSFGMQFAKIKSLDVTRALDPNSVEGQVKKLRSRWDISFPQAMLWGVLGCVAGFSISIAKERSQGTLVRLQASPLSKTQILLGKALACFLAALMVMVLMTSLGYFLQLRPASWLKLIVAGISTAGSFVGIMMTVSVLGKTEQSVSGTGWAINMIMAMLGGCMIPVMFMPAFLQRISVVSPIRWAILAIEGAIWRDFSWAEMLLPCGLLLVIGAVGFTVGMSILSRRD